MTTCVSQLKIIIDEIADKIQLPAIKHTHQCLFVIWTLIMKSQLRSSITLYTSHRMRNQNLSSLWTTCTKLLVWTYRRQIVFKLNEICNSSDMLRHIQFPHLDHERIGALLVVNSLLFRCPLRGFEGNYLISSAVQTKLEWTLAGEYPLKKKQTTTTLTYKETSNFCFPRYSQQNNRKTSRLSYIAILEN